MPGRDRGVRRKKQVPKRQRMDLQDVPVAENTGDGLSGARNSEDDESHGTRCQKHRGSNSFVCQWRRNDSRTSTGRGKYSKNNLTNGAMCRRRGCGTGRGRKGRKNDSIDGKRKGRGGGKRRPGTNNDEAPNDDFIDGEDSDVEDYKNDDLRVYRKKPRPVRHCKNLYSDTGSRKNTTSVADGDDDSDSDDDTDDDTDDDDDDDSDDDTYDDPDDDDDDCDVDTDDGDDSDNDKEDVPNDDFIDDEEDSDVEDSEVDNLRVYRKKPRPVRHCKSLYSDIGSRKSTTSVADDDDDSDRDDDIDDDTDGDDDSDNDKEDAKEKNVKETPKKGRPYRRSLGKDLKDASKTLSGRMTRSRTKFTTNSPKKSSQSHQEHASSSKGPVTAIFIETDEESDDDRIKPVSFAKKSNKMDSDSDSDATVSSLEPPSSTGKRKGSDDAGDYNDDEKDKSSKKKRIKTTEKNRIGAKKTNGAEESSSSDSSSSSSSSSGSDTDSNDNSSSDTHSYHSGHDNNDDQWVEEGPLEDNNYNIEQLRVIQGDDDGTLDMLRHYILWFALKAGGVDVDDEIYEETVDAKTKLDGRLEVVMNICQSQAWGPNFRLDVMAYPKFVVYKKRKDLRGGDMRYLGNCQVCNRESHPWSVIVRLEGEQYKTETFEMIAKEEGEDSVELPPVQYYMGCFCHPRSKLYHNLYHFGYYLYQRCKEMLEERVDDEKRIDTVATDKSLLDEMYSKLKKWMKEAEKDYTEDGERANNRWTREHKF